MRIDQLQKCVERSEKLVFDQAVCDFDQVHLAEVESWLLLLETASSFQIDWAWSKASCLEHVEELFDLLQHCDNEHEILRMLSTVLFDLLYKSQHSVQQIFAYVFQRKVVTLYLSAHICQWRSLIV